MTPPQLKLPRLSPGQTVGAALAVLLTVLVLAALVWRDDILQTGLDPKVPFQTYDPPPAPDYAKAGSWALIPADPRRWTAKDPPADVFFIHPTTYDGGRDWNAPIDDSRSSRVLERVMLPNYAGPFLRVGRVFAPRYRQASLYTQLTLREDAREARRFPYEDVRESFLRFVRDYNRGRPIVVVGVDQGGLMADRLVREVVASDPELKARLAAVYLIDTVVPRDRHEAQDAVPACRERRQSGCVVAWIQAPEDIEEQMRNRLDRALIWTDDGDLEPIGDRPALCVNPLLGAETDAEAPKRLNKGAANATGFEWGARPGILSRQVSARCDSGQLRVSRPTSASLRVRGTWGERRKAPGFNLFYADLEADAQDRIAKLFNRTDFPMSAPPIDATIDIGDSAIHRAR